MGKTSLGFAFPEWSRSMAGPLEGVRILDLTTVGYGTGALLGRGVKQVSNLHWKKELGLKAVFKEDVIYKDILAKYDLVLAGKKGWKYGLCA